MMREYHVRICERLGVKFPGSTRQSRWLPDAICQVSLISGPRMPCDGLAAGGRQTRRAQTGLELKMLEISTRKLWPRFGNSVSV